MASICFSILFPLCSFSIFHSCIMDREISVKNFSGAARLRKVKFSTNIGNDKLYCVGNSQLSPAYVFFHLSLNPKPSIVNIIIYEYILSPKVFFFVVVGCNIM